MFQNDTKRKLSMETFVLFCLRVTLHVIHVHVKFISFCLVAGRIRLHSSVLLVSSSPTVFRIIPGFLPFFEGISHSFS